MLDAYALQMAARLHKLLRHLRYLYRSSDTGKSAQVTELKSMLQKNPQWRNQNRTPGKSKKREASALEVKAREQSSFAILPFDFKAVDEQAEQTITAHPLH